MIPASAHRNNYYACSLLCTGCDGETIASHRFVQIIMRLSCLDNLVEAPSSECCLGEEEPPEVCMIPFADTVTHPASMFIQLKLLVLGHCPALFANIRRPCPLCAVVHPLLSLTRSHCHRIYDTLSAVVSLCTLLLALFTKIPSR